MPSRLTTTAAAAAAAVLAGSAAALAAGTPTSGAPPRVAFVARGDGTNFADALVVGSIAGQLGAPVFTTTKDVLPAESARALSEHAPEIVVITGGEGAVSAAVETAVEAATNLPDDQVVRAAGDNRYGTAAAIAQILDLPGVNPAWLPVGATATDADMLDGLDSTAFQPAGDYLTADDASDFAPAGDYLTADDASDFAPASDYLTAADALDADTLDGLDSTDFLDAGLVDLLPVAVVNVAGDGDLDNATFRAPVTATPTVNRTNTGVYTVTLPGVANQFFADSYVCTIQSGLEGAIRAESLGGSDFRVTVVDLAGDPADARFSCAVHDS